MRARSTDMESVDVIDPMLSGEAALAGRTGALREAELIAPATEDEAYPSEGTVVDFTDMAPTGGNTVDGIYGSATFLEALWHVDLDNLHTLELDPPIWGTGGNDVIEGRHYISDTIYGRAGDDIIYGGDELFEGDRLEGESGNDQIFGGHGHDVIGGGDGNDVIEGGAGWDTIYGSGGDDVLRGGEGNDKLWGMTGTDTAHGGLGDDYIDLGGYANPYGGTGFGDEGNDYIIAGDGVDHLYGGEGNDKIKSGNDTDYLDGGEGDDVLEGGQGHDMLWGRAGNDTIEGESGYDIVYAGAGDDTVYGDHINPLSPFGEADSLHGEEGNDAIYAAGGNDYLYGGADNDLLHGGTGDDVLEGGAGADRITGGDGRDTFVITQADNLGYSLDTITDFMRNPPIDGGDIVDLRQVFNAHTDFTGTTAEQAVLQGYLYFRQIGSPGEAGYGVMIQVDPNGSAADTHPYYHDMPVAFLEGVGLGELGTPGPNYGGLSNHFLV